MMTLLIKFKSAIFYVLVTIALIISSQIAFTQTLPFSSHSDRGYWLSYSGMNRLTSSWGVHSELQLRNFFVEDNTATVLTRVGVSRFWQKGISVTVGYGFITMHPWKENEFETSSIEHRIWQQLQYPAEFGKFSMDHRYRVEQRFVKNTLTESYASPGYRMRYRYQLSHPLFQLSKSSQPIHVIMNNEVFINFKSEPQQLFDRNRFFLGLSYKYNHQSQIQFGFMNQYVNDYMKNAAVSNNIALLAWSFNPQLFKARHRE